MENMRKFILSKAKGTKILKLTIFTVAVFGLGFFAFSSEARAAIDCNDGRDNDNDGKIDYSTIPEAGDLQCLSATDDHESDNPIGFFQKHSVFRQKIPATSPPINSGRSSAISSALVADSVGLFVAVGAYPVYVINETSTPYEIHYRNGVADDWAWDTYHWNEVLLNTTNLSDENTQECANHVYPYHDNELIIRNANNTQEWDLTRISWCDDNGINGLSDDVPKFDEWTAVARMYRNSEDGVSSHNSSDGFMGCTWNSDYTVGTSDGLGSPATGKWSRLVGALTYEEVANNMIQHAISFTYIWRNTSPGYNPPYPSCDGWSGYSPTGPGKDGYPMSGERLFLDRTYAQIDSYISANSLSQAHKNVLYAIKDYGMIMTEAWGNQNVGLHVETTIEHDVTAWNTLFGGDTHFKNHGSIYQYLKVVNPIGSLKPPFADQDQCADDMDNDGDGKIDYPADPGCSSAYGDGDESDTSVNPADVNSDGNISIKDIQICVKAIVAPGSFTTPDELNQLSKCQAVAPPETTVNIKDIQEIIKAIIGG